MRKLGLIFWACVMLGSLWVTGLRFYEGAALDTNFMALLPEEDQNDLSRKANDLLKSQGAERIVILIKGEDFTHSKQDALKIVEALKPFAERQNIRDNFKELATALFPYRAGLLSAQDRDWLLAGEGSKVSKRALAQIISPFGISNAQTITQDPYLLFPAFLASAPPHQAKYGDREGWTVVQDYIVLIFHLQGNAFDQDFQKGLSAALDQVDLSNGSQLLKTGVVFYAQKGAAQGQSEATLIGAISLIAIILLNLVVFRSVRPMLLSLLTILSGVGTGLGVSFIVFEKLHIMAFIFGAGLIGIAVDYTFHYCCEAIGKKGSNALERTQTIAKPLTLGMVSSVIGFAILSTAPFPGLRQIALFAASGLFMAYLTVMCVYPFIDKSTVITHLTRLWVPSRRISVTVCVCALMLGGIGVINFHVDDDVRRLQQLPPDLKQQEDQIRTLTGVDNAMRFLVISGGNEEQLLQKEEALAQGLDQLVDKGILGDYQAISQFIPSQHRQKENRKLVARSLLGDALVAHQSRLGMTPHPDVYDQKGYMTPEGYMADLRLTPTLHVIRLNALKSPQALEDLLTGFDGVVLLDQARSIGQLLGKYRQRALVLTALACLVVGVLLTLRYNVKSAVKVLTIPVFAVITTPFIGAAFGESFTFFNAMALLLVLMIGLDYALFSYEASEHNQAPIMLANGLSALSTILAFGLLSFSDLYAIHAFGITILIGILIAYFAAPLILKNGDI